jgi:inhibitor of KinA
MTWVRQGESCWLLRDLPGPAFLVAAKLEDCRVEGLLEAVPAYDTVGLYVDPDRFTPEALGELDLTDLASVANAPNEHVVPVCYEMNLDLDDVARMQGISAETAVEAHTATTYTCYAVGFCPGFAYLGNLPEPLAGVPRLATPRTQVQPGSVGIAGPMTGVYPLPRPGGWRLIGRTPLTLVSLEDAYFPIRCGDRVRFQRIDESEFWRLAGERL